MPYRDGVPRVSLAQVRAMFTPRAFRALGSVTLEGTEVALVRAPGGGVAPGDRPWFVCPGCGGRANVLGCVGGAWVCPACGRWRSRNRNRQGVAEDSAKGAEAVGKGAESAADTGT